MPRLAKGAKTRLLTLADLDSRTQAAQHATEVCNAIFADLGGEAELSTLEKLQAENCAVMAAVLRDAQCRWLRGEPVQASELATLENTFNRTAAALGTQRRARDITMTASEYIQRKQHEGSDG